MLIAQDFQEVLHCERQNEVEGSPEPAKRAGAAKWLSNAIELESAM